MAAAKDEDPGNPTIDFRGEPRRNATHQSRTDPDSVLERKASGKEARRWCFGAHALMENPNGLCADFTLHNPITESEPMVALQQADALQQLYRDMKLKALGADKGYLQKGFVQGGRERGIVPQVACKDNLKGAGLDGRTTTQRSYQVSLKIRKRVEEIFGWIKTVGGLRRSRYRGLEGPQAWGYFVAGTYNRRRPETRPQTGRNVRRARNARRFGSGDPEFRLRLGQPLRRFPCWILKISPMKNGTAENSPVFQQPVSGISDPEWIALRARSPGTPVADAEFLFSAIRE